MFNDVKSIEEAMTHEQVCAYFLCKWYIIGFKEDIVCLYFKVIL